MRKSFPGYYNCLPTEEEFKALWEDCLFVFDTNVLLNLYRYTPGTSEELLSILSKVSDRIWIPHQAAWEYQRNRRGVIEKQKAVYTKIQTVFNDYRAKLNKALGELSRHPFIKVDDFSERLGEVLAEIQAELVEGKKEYPDWLSDDKFRDTITDLLEGKVGPPYSYEELEKIYMKGKRRYECEIPPGFQDTRDKTETRGYGDLVMWFQIIDQAKETQSPIIFVTDDRKDDWWLKEKGKTVGPHPELVNEMALEARVLFYMYNADRFMEYARKYLDYPVEQQAIEEVQKLRQYDEALENLTMQERAARGAILDSFVSSEAALEAFARQEGAMEVRISGLESAAEQQAATLAKFRGFRSAAEQQAMAALRSFDELLVEQQAMARRSFDELAEQQAMARRSFDEFLVERQAMARRSFDELAERQAMATPSKKELNESGGSLDAEIASDEQSDAEDENGNSQT